MKRFNVINVPVILSPQALAIQLASKLNFWYSADNLTVIDNLVAGATDLSGNGRDGVQNTVADRLTYFSSDSMFGNRPSFGSTSNTGNRRLSTPSSLGYRHQIFSAYYKDGIDNAFDALTTFSSGTGTGGNPRLMGNVSSAALLTNSAFASGIVSLGGETASTTILPLPASVVTSSNASLQTTTLQIGGVPQGLNGDNRVLVGAFRHFVGASQVLTTQEIQLIEGVIAWNDGIQATLISGHPYRNSPPTI